MIRDLAALVSDYAQDDNMKWGRWDPKIDLPQPTTAVSHLNVMVWGPCQLLCVNPLQKNCHGEHATGPARSTSNHLLGAQQALIDRVALLISREIFRLRVS